MQVESEHDRCLCADVLVVLLQDCYPQISAGAWHCLQILELKVIQHATLYSSFCLACADEHATLLHYDRHMLSQTKHPPTWCLTVSVCELADDEF